MINYEQFGRKLFVTDDNERSTASTHRRRGVTYTMSTAGVQQLHPYLNLSLTHYQTTKF